ncbi:MAG: hypothetical protein IJB49_05480 [Clostridia bacterium]|nr:hypothetical protein [Clostridia bacterium]
MKKALSLVLSFAILLLTFCFSAVAESEITAVAFGDSITAAGKWQKVLESEWGLKLVNKGVGGDSTRSARARFQRDVLNLSPDLVFISFGTNDAAIDMAKHTPLEEFKENLAYFIDSCIDAGARVIVNIPIPIDDAPYLTRHEAEPFEPYGGPNGLLSLYAEAARGVALEKGVPFADVHKAFMQTENYKKYLSDGVHPTDAGYKLYGNTLLSLCRTLFAGDVNGDLSVSPLDYMLAKRHCLNTVELSAVWQKRGDINGDGALTAVDYALVKRICLGTYNPQGY